MRTKRTSFFNSRRWKIVYIGLNPRTGTHSVTHADFAAFGRHLFFGSCGPWNVSTEDLTVEIATNVLRFCQSSDVFVVLPGDVSRDVFDAVSSTFEEALNHQAIAGNFCCGKMSADSSSVLVLHKSGNRFVHAERPENCPNWDKRKPFPMPDGTFAGLQIHGDAQSA